MSFSTTQARAAGQEDLRRIGGLRPQEASLYLLLSTCFLLICHPLRDEDAAPGALEESGLGEVRVVRITPRSYGGSVSMLPGSEPWR